AEPAEPADQEDPTHRTADPPRETPSPLRHTPPPPAEPRSAPAAQGQDARSLNKRPMVLKPRRPPIPDLSSAPPSRHVRSEPMRPEDCPPGPGPPAHTARRPGAVSSRAPFMAVAGAGAYPCQSSGT